MSQIEEQLTDFQSQMKYHQLLNSLTIETESDLSMRHALESEPGYRSPSIDSTDSPREPESSVSSWTDDSEEAEDSKRDDFLLLLDWDDTLFPTSWLTEVLQNTKNGVAMVNDEEMANLDRLGKHTLQLLRAMISKYGAHNVYIVTNSLEGWIRDSLHYAACISAVYKDIEALLDTHEIAMLSAQTLYKSADESSTPTEWKKLCFSAITSSSSCHYAHILSIGDQWTDHFAAKQSIDTLTTQQAPVPLHHIVKLKTKPTVCDMINEILYVETCFVQIFDVLSSKGGQCVDPVVVDYHREELKYYSSLNVNN